MNTKRNGVAGDEGTTGAEDRVFNVADADWILQESAAKQTWPNVSAKGLGDLGD